MTHFLEISYYSSQRCLDVEARKGQEEVEVSRALTKRGKIEDYIKIG